MELVILGVLALLRAGMTQNFQGRRICGGGDNYPRITCSRSSWHSRQRCPTGYVCLSMSPRLEDGTGVCCLKPVSSAPIYVQPPCPVGSPLPNVFCGTGLNRQDCPRGYSCYPNPVDKSNVCCRESQSRDPRTGIIRTRPIINKVSPH